jgi:hypothetical protein
MSNGFDELRALADEATDYARLRWASLRLDATERLSVGAAQAVGLVVGAVVMLFALVFLMTAASLWIGEAMGRPLWGFLIVGGAFMLIGAVLLALGRRMFAGAMVKFFVKLFFTDNDYRHGTKN